ncbi:MAG TPA: LytR C-terminal domain-containing protein [Solirubrobacteraceae bacterium]|jgi:hypothetical protein|nr:LytR C-terminal domain-containing protein [Solirubrobacteraceae bacterium]
MGLAPYALSVHHFISSVGADAGFASIIGLAILVLLYFAQARETASLREQAELAAQRVAQLESRLAHAVAVQSAPVPTPSPLPGVAPRPGLIPQASNRPEPAFAATPSPAPPAGVGAPPLSAATKLIPTPPAFGGGVAAAEIAGLAGRSPVAAPDPQPAVAPGQPSPAAPGQPSPAAPGQAHSPAPGQPGAPGFGPAQGVPFAGGAAGATKPAPAPGSPPGGPPPMNRIVTPRPATAAGGSGVFGGPAPTNGTGEHPVIPPPPPPRPPVQIRPGSGAGGGNRPRMLSELDDGGGSPSDLTRVLMALAAVAVVAAIVIVLISLTSGSGTPSAHTTAHSTTPVSNAPTAATRHHSAAKPAAVNNASVTVAVLNGTAVFHLADSVATQLGAAGFKQGTIANAATQTQPSTTVEYVPGDQRQAAVVAKDLKLSTSAVQPITPDVQSLGCPQVGSCNVVVTVGADLASSGTQTSTTG